MRTTVDAILDGAVELEQPAPGEGYRVNVDSVHLARFVAPHVARDAHVVDLGAGVGAVALCVAHLAHPGRLTLVDVDGDACTLARRNLARAQWGKFAEVSHADVQHWPHGPLPADVVVSNPPYTQPGRGRGARSNAVQRARHGDVRQFLQAAARVGVPERTLVAMSYPVHALAAVVSAATDLGLALKAATFVHGSPSAPARLALLLWTIGSCGPPVILAPVIETGARRLHDRPGRG